MRFVVYTSVFGGYDRIFSPIDRAADIEHVIFTDDSSLRVDGWRTEAVDLAKASNPRAKSKYFKFFAHELFGDYDASLYIDGKFRLLRNIRPLFEEFMATGAAISAFAHPLRETIESESQICVSLGKIKDPAIAEAELDYYREIGFKDDNGLIESGVLMRNHHDLRLSEAMSLWWSLYERFPTRDQIGLPVALWQTELAWQPFPEPFQERTRYFALYPHVGAKNVRPAYVNMLARSYDSVPHRIGLNLWHASWTARRAARRLLGGKETR